jgi:hypothetical protein
MRGLLFCGKCLDNRATLYVLTLLLARLGPLRPVVTKNTMHCIALVWFAFTVFYAYIHFSQYFLQWNANLPEETFWYVKREQGSWWQIGMLIVFGHFALPFVALLRIDAKLNPTVMIPLAVWVWLMHYCDTSFNIMPVLHPSGFVLSWMDLACLAFMAACSRRFSSATSTRTHRFRSRIRDWVRALACMGRIRWNTAQINHAPGYEFNRWTAKAFSFLGILAAFLIVAVLVGVMLSYNRPPPSTRLG